MSSSPDADLDPATHRQIGEMLARHGHRYTPRRRRLVDVLATAGRPMTLPDVLAADAELSQSSVYRNFDVLERSGILRRLATGAEYAYVELAEPLLEHHHHLICTECGAVEDIELDDRIERAVDDALSRAASSAGFRALHHSVDLHGTCRGCS